MDITPPAASPAPKRPLDGSETLKAKDPDTAARAAAEAFEASFIGEMLKESGINGVSASFGGGAGEEAFSSFLTQEYGKEVAKSGGLGLAEHVFEAIRRREPGA